MSEDIHDLSVVAAKSDEGNVPENLHSIATTKYIAFSLCCRSNQPTMYYAAAHLLLFSCTEMIGERFLS